MNLQIARDREALTAEVREELERIMKEDADGLLQPEAVVQAAHDPESPLHKHFEWDLSKAAHGYWLSQARHIIAQYTYTRVDEGPKYVNVRLSNGRQGYVGTERAVADPDLCQQVMADAEKGIIAYRNRLAAFQRAQPVVVALDQAVEQIHATEILHRKAS